MKSNNWDSTFRKSVVFIAAFVFLFAGELYSQDSTVCKIRLDESINSCQPVLVPVVNIRSNVLYFDRQEHPENTGGFMDKDEIWLSKKKGERWIEPIRLAEPVNSKHNDVLFSISPDEQTALAYGTFTEERSSDPGYALLKRVFGKWVYDRHLNIKKYYNKSELFYGYLSYNGKVLLLSAVRDDSYGSHDLYVSFFNEKDSVWSEPRNLGNDVNTIGSEASPFLAFDGKTLYFASDGYDGHGKLDLFMTRRLGDSWQKWSKPVNLGDEINSKRDDKSIYLTALGDSAFVVSYDTTTKRPGIYKICIPEKLRPEPYALVYGKVKIRKKGNAYTLHEKVKVRSGDNYDITDPASGEYVLIENKSLNNIQLDVVSDKYDSVRAVAKKKPSDYSSPEFVNIDLVVSDSKEPLPDTSITIYFDFNSDELNEKAREKLEDLDIDAEKIVITGHTDTVGTVIYNLHLSKRRARNTANNLTNQGFSPRKMEIIPKGESDPVSEEQARNRRVEVLFVRSKNQ